MWAGLVGVGVLVGGFALGLIGSGTFVPDPMAGFPPGAGSDVSVSGMLQLVFGAFQFACLAAACWAASRWMVKRGDAKWGGYSRVSAAAILAGFLGGAAIAQSPIGVALLWVAVVASYAWITATSIYLWHTVPHPDAHKRVGMSERT